ncbi:NADH-quinone oxidoreductase subunit L [bacterium]|nr:NADH-quinone oxidoreductase subunit L [bacterium]
MINNAWLIPGLPLIAFIIITFFTKRLRNISSYLSIGIMMGSFLLACGVLKEVIIRPGRYEFSLPWFETGSFQIEVGMLIDPLCAVMLVVVTLVSLMIQIYSRGYLETEKDVDFSRYYSFISLFTFSMLGLVVANNFVTIFVGWELVGLCSYLLIGYWHHKPSAAAAAKKAFIITRLADAGFLIGILCIAFYAGTFNFLVIERLIQEGQLTAGILSTVAILIFLGAMGKSAQFPFHTWLPDAMEGPSPVSALIHAATMVAAGVYLVARTYAIFDAGLDSLIVVGYVGGFTALFAASIGLCQNDIKRVLAYSTLSQLGYMMLALGVGGFTAGMFHLTTHAFFKALLFLAAGSVIHAMRSNDIWDAGGLGKKMPATATVFIIGSLAISGVPPFAGFWSKEEILVAAYTSGHLPLFIMGEIGAFLTAFYMFRLCFVTFGGQLRKKDAHPHESPLVMIFPMGILAFLSIVAGLIDSPWMGHWFGKFVFFESQHLREAHGGHQIVAILSLSAAFLGILGAWLVYGRKVISLEFIKPTVIYKTVFNKYYFDEIYQAVIIKPFVGLTRFALSFDSKVVDGLVNGVASITAGCGAVIRHLQTGLVQTYMIMAMSGLIVLLFIWMF